jgi:hypothetical protein
MNYRRGLLRLWLIASVLWIAFVGWLYWSEIYFATGLHIPATIAQMRQEEKQRAEATEKAQRRWETAKQAIAKRKLNFPEADLTAEKREELDALFALSLKNADRFVEPEELWKLWEQVRHSPERAMVPGIVRAAFLPPLGLLALGALLGWALRGFKPTT